MGIFYDGVTFLPLRFHQIIHEPYHFLFFDINFLFFDINFLFIENNTTLDMVASDLYRGERAIAFDPSAS